MQVAAPAALLGIDVALSLLAGWSWWPWLYGLGGVVVLSILRIRRWLGEGLTLAVALLVVLVFLLERVPLLVWGIVAGTLLAGLGVLLLLPRVGRLLPAALPRTPAAAALLGVGLALGVTCSILYAVQQAERAAQQQALASAEREDHLARALPATPQALLTNMVEAVAEPDINHLCGHRWTFTPQAEAQFVAAHGGPDCPTVVRRLHEQISDWNTYVNEFYARSEWFHPRDHGPRVEIDACHMTWSSLLRDVPTQPGPQLGYLTAERQHGHGYRITAYRACE